jgi:hypothetical protein
MRWDVPDISRAPSSTVIGGCTQAVPGCTRSSDASGTQHECHGPPPGMVYYLAGVHQQLVDEVHELLVASLAKGLGTHPHDVNQKATRLCPGTYIHNTDCGFLYGRSRVSGNFSDWILGLIPEGRESGTHSEHLNFKKVAREPNRFKSVFISSSSEHQRRGYGAGHQATRSTRNTGRTARRKNRSYKPILQSTGNF